MALVEIRDATEADADFIARRVRKADFDEIVASSGKHPYYAMIQGLSHSTSAKTATFNGEPACMWGVAPGGMILQVGVPWMVGTDLLDQHAKAFLRRCRKPVMSLLDGYAILMNYVDARNVRAVEWLAFCGFTVDDAEPFGLSGQPFHKFWMSREN